MCVCLCVHICIYIYLYLFFFVHSTIYFVKSLTHLSQPQPVGKSLLMARERLSAAERIYYTYKKISSKLELEIKRNRDQLEVTEAYFWNGSEHVASAYKPKTCIL